MATLIKASIDLTKIKKEHLKKLENGAIYLNLDIWVNDSPDKFGNTASIAQPFKSGDTWDKIYIGNGKPLATKPKEHTTEQPNQNDDLPF